MKMKQPFFDSIPVVKHFVCLWFDGKWMLIEKTILFYTSVSKQWRWKKKTFDSIRKS